MAEVNTLVDKFLDAINKESGSDMGMVIKDAGIDQKTAENWIKLLPDYVDVSYPINPLKQPHLRRRVPKKRHQPILNQDIGGRQIDKYGISVDNVPAEVAIQDKKGDVMRTYALTLPFIGEGTQGLLSNVVKDLAGNATTPVENVADPRKVQEIKKVFQDIAKKRIMDAIPVSSEQADLLSGLALHRVYGMGDLEVLLGDEMIEEICINASNTPIIIYHRKHGWLKSNIIIKDEDDIFDYAAQIGRRVGKDITNLNPMMDARLITGDRVMASVFPISAQGNTITIRKFSRDPWTIVDFMSPEYNSISPNIAAFLWMCIEYELSVMVAGGTASGKTSMLNSLCAFIPPGQRVVSIEDTREIQLPSHLKFNWIQLTTRDPNPDGLGGVSMLDLIIASLRMRPDRIIVGEIRARDEAEVLFEAMHTGHSVYSTMHADTCMHVKRRVTEPPIHIPEAELEALQVIMTQYRDRLHGIRRTFEIAEVIPGTSERKLELKYLFRWRVKSDTFESIDKSTRVYNDLNLYTGMTGKEIDQDLRQKREILEWLLEKRINKMNEIGRIMNMYYTQKDDLMAVIEGREQMT